MQFTDQQQRGGSRFNPKCLIGNWNEDVELEKTKLKDFLAKKDTGTLALDGYQQRMATALADMQLSKVRDDGFVHFGDLVQLIHVDSGAVLSCDIGDKDPRPGELYCAAAASRQLRQPVARNTLLLTKYVPSRVSPFETLYDDDVLHYGQKVRLVSNPELQDEPLDCEGGSRPLSLFSRPVSTTHSAKYSKNQLVGFTWRNNYDSVWQVVAPNPADRGVSEGVEVAACAPLVLLHCATQRPLALEERAVRPSDYGAELEVSVRPATANGMQSGLEHAQTGRLTSTIPKRETGPNIWTILNGDAVRELPQASRGVLDAAAALRALSSQLLVSSAGLAGLEKRLVLMSGPSGVLAGPDFASALAQTGLSLSAAEVEALSQRFAALGMTGGPRGSVNTLMLLDALKAMP